MTDLKVYLDHFFDWLDQHLPTRCPLCGKWTPKKTMRLAEHRLAGWVLICRHCHKNLYGGDDGHH